jgi:aryl-alcohol dehydrogenase-like predicted oxidoreductase
MTATISRRPLGGSGLEVSSLALGTMMFGRWGNPDPRACRRMVDIALDAGINLLDTADIYDFGISERIVGDAIAGRRDGVVLATKVGNAMSDDPAERGLSRRWIHASCDASLRRLGLDHIDVYQMHRPDPDTPLEESLGAFDELVAAGKVGAVGTSTFSATQLDELQRLAGDHDWIRPTSEQPPYSVFVRGIEAEVLPTCRRNGIGVLVWAPLNGGWLTGKYQRDDSVDPASRALREPDHFDHRDADMRARKRALVDRLAAVAAEAGHTLTQLALGFALANADVTAVLLGPRTPEQLTELLDPLPVPLEPDVLAAIDAIVPPGTNVNPADAA